MSMEAITKALEEAEDLHERRVNGFASIEHESQLMDAAPKLCAALRVSLRYLQEREIKTIAGILGAQP